MTTVGLPRSFLASIDKNLARTDLCCVKGEAHSR
jgi:hypothetical protein